MCIASLARELVGAPAHLDEHAELVRGRVRVGLDEPPSPASKRAVPATTMFSPSLAASCWRSSSSSASAPGPSASTSSSTFSANAWNSSLFDTGSVSQPIATMVPFEPPSEIR